MKKLFEKVILLSFLLFYLGGLTTVVIQTIGLLSLNNELMMDSKDYFSWIFPLASVTGLMCYVHSYFKNK
jgi:hypothetical protein